MVEWLPSINSGYVESDTHVYIAQRELGSWTRPRPDVPIHNTFLVKFNASVQFHPPNDPKSPNIPIFKGLQIFGAQIQIPFDEICPERVALELEDKSSLRFHHDDLTWVEKNFLQHHSPPSELASGADLYEKIVNFLCAATEKPQNRGCHTIVVELDIEREITISVDELQSWHAWYEEKKRYDPVFDYEFKLAISRPRYLNEEPADPVESDDGDGVLLRMEKIWFGNNWEASCCPICFEDFVPGSVLGRLGCGHFFDSICITRWLHTSNMCPTCRYDEA